MARRRFPAIEGWFTTDDAAPRLLGNRCSGCGSYFFPKESVLLPQSRPARARSSRRSRSATRGKLWSFTNNCYPPPEALRVTGSVRALHRRRGRARRGEDGRARSGRAGGRDRRAHGRHGDGARARHAVRRRRQRVPRLEVEARSPDRLRKESTRWQKKSQSSESACTPGASGGRTSSSTASRPRATRSTTPVSSGRTFSSSRAATRFATATPATWPVRRSAQALGWTGARVASSLRCVRVGRAGDQRRARADSRRHVRRRAGGRRRHGAERLLRPDRRRPPGRSRLAALPAARRNQPDLLRPLCAAAHGSLRRDRGRLRQGQGQELRATG